MIMNETQKNIETCRGEDVLAEVSGLPQDPHFGSLVNEALDPLKQQAAAQEGWDGYSEVIAQHKPYTFASAIIQMKSNLLLLLRALWQFPFGSGTLRSLSDDASLRSLSDDASLRSLSDMWSHYITRLQGNAEYGIPSRLSSLTDLPSAPLLLADRKISNGSAPNDGIPDGVSLAHLLLNAETAAAVLEIADDNKGYTINRSFNYTAFPNARRFKLAASKIIGQFRLFNVVEHLEADELEYIGMPEGTTYGYYPQETFLASEIDDETVTLPKLKTVYNGAGSGNPALGNLPNCKTLNLPSLHNVKTNGSGWLGPNTGSTRLANAPECLVCITNIGGDTNRNNASAGYIFLNAPKLQRFVLGGVLTINNDKGLFNTTSTDLIDIEIGGATCDLHMEEWNPTLTEANTATFLQNFRSHIALRLATFDSNGPTLTLSQAVYDAIKDESHLFVFDEGTMTIYAYLTNIKHWTVTK